MIPVRGYAAQQAKAPLEQYSFERRNPRDHDVTIDIQHCGICHTDIHQVRNEWGGSPRLDYNNVQVFPVNFATMHKDILAHTNDLLSIKKIRIHPNFEKLITSLRTAMINTNEGNLDKDATSYNDIFDAFRM
jgi:hypothetical protein